MTTSIDASIRVAKTGDLAFLAESHRLGHSAIANARGGDLDIALRGRPEPIEESFAASLDEEHTHVLIGEVAGVPVGYLVGTVELLRTGDHIFRVSDLWVHPNARGIGTGGELMRKAMDIARGAGCIGIDARALPGDRVTKNFFESFGLVARSIEVHKSL